MYIQPPPLFDLKYFLMVPSHVFVDKTYLKTMKRTSWDSGLFETEMKQQFFSVGRLSLTTTLFLILYRRQVVPLRPLPKKYSILLAIINGAALFLLISVIYFQNSSIIFHMTSRKGAINIHN